MSVEPIDPLTLADARLGRLAALPRARFGHSPTPIEPLARLTLAAGGAELWVKRDDCTGLALGGNKVRQLEFYLGEALARDADTVLITGAVQSNFVRLAAAAAATLGMRCHVQLEERVPGKGAAYRNSGNVVLDRLLGATLHAYPHGEDEEGADRRLHEIAAELEAAGARPYVIPLGPGHPPHGALGYVVAAAETLGQGAAMGVAFDRVVVASGSGNTHAGLLFGLRALGCDVPVHGVCVRRGADAQAPRIAARCAEIAALLGCPDPVAADDVLVTDAFLAPGYGRLNPASEAAIVLAARTEALILDPVYTAKTMAGALALARDGAAGERILFVHTGGTPVVFAYEPELSEAFADASSVPRAPGS